MSLDNPKKQNTKIPSEDELVSLANKVYSGEEEFARMRAQHTELLLQRDSVKASLDVRDTSPRAAINKAALNAQLLDIEQQIAKLDARFEGEQAEHGNAADDLDSGISKRLN